jgi:hypothetical protein
VVVVAVEPGAEFESGVLDGLEAVAPAELFLEGLDEAFAESVNGVRVLRFTFPHPVTGVSDWILVSGWRSLFFLIPPQALNRAPLAFFARDRAALASMPTGSMVWLAAELESVGGQQDAEVLLIGHVHAIAW